MRARFAGREKKTTVTNNEIGGTARRNETSDARAAASRFLQPAAKPSSDARSRSRHVISSVGGTGRTSRLRRSVVAHRSDGAVNRARAAMNKILSLAGPLCRRATSYPHQRRAVAVQGKRYARRAAATRSGCGPAERRLPNRVVVFSRSAQVHERGAHAARAAGHRRHGRQQGRVPELHGRVPGRRSGPDRHRPQSGRARRHQVARQGPLFLPPALPA